MLRTVDYDRKKKKIQSSVGGKLAVFLLWREIFITTGKKKIHYDRKKKRYSRLWREISIFFVVAGNFDYDRKKYIYSREKKKDTVVCLLGARFWRLRPEKKKIQSSVCWVRGSGDYDRKKKKIQSPV